MPYYAVKQGKTPGIYKTWSECEENIKGVNKAIFKKFETEIEANEFVNRTESKNKIFIDNKTFAENKYYFTDNYGATTSTRYCFVDTNEKKEISINTKNLSIENDHVVNRNHDFSSSINIYLNSIYLSENGNMKSIGSISIYFGSDDTRNELRKLEYDKYKDMTSDTVLFKSVLVAFNKVITEIVEEKSIILHTDSIDCIKYLTNDLVYTKNLPSYELIAKGHMIIKKYPNIKFYHSKSSYCTDWIHDINIFEAKRLNLENLKEYYDKMVFIFGKFKNCSFGKIFKSNPDYFDWCLINCKLQINEIRLFLESKND